MEKKKIVLVIFLILIGGLELYFRIYNREELKDQIYPRVWMPDSLYGYKYIPNYKGPMSSPGIQYKNISINSHGYIGQDFNTTKKKGVYRIIVVGSSKPGGIWSNGTKNYTTILQELFRKNNYNIEIINCCTDGYGRSKRNIDLIKRELIGYQPDLILLETQFPFAYKRVNREIYRNYKIEYKLNSAIGRKKAMAKIDNIYRYSYLTWPYKYSYIIRAFCKWYFERYADMDLADYYFAFVTKNMKFRWESYYYSVDASLQLLKETQQVLLKNKTKLFLLAYEIDENKKLLFEQNHLSCIYLTCQLDSSARSLPDSHPNQKGHMLIANNLYQPLVNIYLNQHPSNINR